MTSLAAAPDPIVVDPRPATIVFVDRDPAIRSALQARLHRHRRELRCVFLTTPAEARALLADEPVDVLVTDIGMRDGSGIALLEHARDEHPSVVRYILSARTDHDLLLRALPIAHRWLVKPCGREQLLEALSGAVRHQRSVPGIADRAAVGALVTLPSPPTTYRRVRELMADPDATLDDVVAVIEADPAVTAKLLQWANSAFSGGRMVGDVRTAAKRVGLETLSELVLSAEVLRTMATGDTIPGLPIEILARHAGVTGRLAGELARPDEAATARIAGILHLTGLLLEAETRPAELAEAYQRARCDGERLLDVERRSYGAGFADLGAHLLSVWGLPTPIIEAALGAHDVPSTDLGSLDTVNAGSLGAVDAVRIARIRALSAPHARAIGSPHHEPEVRL